MRSLVQQIRRTKQIIWDEAPMTHRHCFEVVDRSFRNVLKKMMELNKPIGGWIGFSNKIYILKIELQKNFYMDRITKQIWIERNQYLIYRSLNMILHLHPFFHNNKTWIFVKTLIKNWMSWLNLEWERKIRRREEWHNLLYWFTLYF